MMERSFAGYTFERAGRIRPECDDGGEVIEELPQSRYANKGNLPLHKYGDGPFCRFRIAQEDRWRRRGVYVLTNDDGPLYVGECKDLEARWGTRGYGSISPRNCYKGGQQTNCRINNLIYRGTMYGAAFDLWFHSVESHKQSRKAVESKLVVALNPPWNK